MDEEIDLATGWGVLMKKREAIGKKAQEIIEASEEGKCSYDKGYITQELYLCKTCNISSQGSGICVGCYLTCHLDHEVSELGPKANFRCDCGNSRLKSTCSFIQKTAENQENVYNQNFLGKFCICSQEDSDDRESEMYMCIGCYDWFHADCIELSNNCHNHSTLHEEHIPKIPSDNIDNFYMICLKCINEWKFIPNAYKEFIYFDHPVKRVRNDGCPLESADISKEFPYHVFLLKDWVSERCSCETCREKFWPNQFLNAQEIEEKVSLLGMINEETEKIMQEENIVTEDREEPADDLLIHMSKLPHETQINVANGYQILKETFEELAGKVQGGVCDLETVEEFKQKLYEKYSAYKKSKTDNY